MLVGVVALVACTGRTRTDGVDVSSLSPARRADYEIFSQRCSKCHSLARPLLSGIDDDAHWERYFERMRLTPGSGLMPEDKGPILRFLHEYSAEKRRQKEAARGAGDDASPPPKRGDPKDDSGALDGGVE